MKRFFFGQEVYPVPARVTVAKRSITRQLRIHRALLVGAVGMMFFAAYSRISDSAHSSTGQMYLLVQEACRNVDAPSAVRIAKSVRRTAQSYQIDAALVLSVIAMESQCQSDSRSKKGALGLMQVMPATGASLGVRDLHEVEGNIDAGARYLSRLITEFHGDISLALAAYNAGPAVVKKLRRIPPFPETQLYVVRVLATYYRLSQAVPA